MGPSIKGRSHPFDNIGGVQQIFHNDVAASSSIFELASFVSTKDCCFDRKVKDYLFLRTSSTLASPSVNSQSEVPLLRDRPILSADSAHFHGSSRKDGSRRAQPSGLKSIWSRLRSTPNDRYYGMQGAHSAKTTLTDQKSSKKEEKKRVKERKAYLELAVKNHSAIIKQGKRLFDTVGYLMQTANSQAATIVMQIKSNGALYDLKNVGSQEDQAAMFSASVQTFKACLSKAESYSNMLQDYQQSLQKHSRIMHEAQQDRKFKEAQDLFRSMEQVKTWIDDAERMTIVMNSAPQQRLDYTCSKSVKAYLEDVRSIMISRELMRDMGRTPRGHLWWKLPCSLFSHFHIIWLMELAVVSAFLHFIVSICTHVTMI